MTPDTLDDLLDRSVPPSTPIAPADVDAMIREARRVARPRRARAAVTAGAIVVLMTGGAGVAAATDAFSWAPWVQDPVGAVPFTMANGTDCELRFAERVGGADAPFVARTNAILKEWYRSADVVGAARSVASPGALDELGPVELQPGETLDSLPPEEVEYRQWLGQWIVWEEAITDAEYRELEEHGLRPGDARLAGSERRGQIQCFDGGRRISSPGADS